MSPAMMVVLAFIGETSNVTGTVQFVPAEDSAICDAENPLSVAIIPVGKLVTEPISL
jgi:hypothetical protein